MRNVHRWDISVEHRTNKLLELRCWNIFACRRCSVPQLRFRHLFLSNRSDFLLVVCGGHISSDFRLDELRDLRSGFRCPIGGSVLYGVHFRDVFSRCGIDLQQLRQRLLPSQYGTNSMLYVCFKRILCDWQHFVFFV